MRYNPYPLINEEKKFMLFWTPKCAATSLTLWFFANLEREEEIDKLPLDGTGAKVHWYRDRIFFKGKNILNKVAYRYLFMIPRLRRLYADPDYFKFTVVRNPYTRVVSAFLSINSNTQSWQRFRQQTGIGDSRLSFIRFLEVISRARVFDSDPHLRPQTSNDCWSGRVRLDLVIKMEELDEGLNSVCERFDLSNRVESLYRQQNRNQPESETCVAEIPFAELMSECNKEQLPHYRDFYNSESRERVDELYAEDVRRLGYSW